MKLISIEMSRLSVLVHATRPHGQLYLPKALTDFLDRYQFVGYPKDLVSTNREKMEFKHGLFQDTAIEMLDIYNDGIVVAARSSTEILDAFVDDLKEFMTTDWGLTFTETHKIKMAYETNLVVQSDKPLLQPVQMYSVIAERISEMLMATNGMDVRYEPFGFTLAIDQTKVASLKPALYKLERRIAIEYEFNQYVSSAPLRTSDHLQLLNELEALMSGASASQRRS